VYVSNDIGTTGTPEVHAWMAGPGGKLTPIAGSPFSGDSYSSELSLFGLYSADAQEPSILVR
jgi:hypothetical protein